MNTEIINIKLYGEGINIRKVSIPYNLKSMLNSEFYEGFTASLLDPYFYHRLNSPFLKNIYNLSKPVVKGTILNQKTKIEIWKKGKRLRNLSMVELLQSHELIPIFSIHEKSIEFNNSHDYYIEKSVGILSKYSFELKLNYLESVSFLTTNIDSTSILYDITIPNSKVFKEQCNSLITHQNIQKI